MAFLLTLAAGYLDAVEHLEKHVFVAASGGPTYCLYALMQRPQLQEFAVVDMIKDTGCDFTDISTFTQISVLENVNLSIRLSLSEDANISLVEENYGRALELQNCYFSFSVNSSFGGNISGVSVVEKSELLVEECDFRFAVAAPNMDFHGVSRYVDAGKVQLFQSSWHGTVLARQAAGLIYEEQETVVLAAGNVIKFAFSRDGTHEQSIEVCAVAFYGDFIDYSADNLLLCTGDAERLNDSANGVCFNDIQSQTIYEKRDEAYVQRNTTANTQYVTPKDQGLHCLRCDELHTGPKCQECTDKSMRYLDGQCRVIVDSPLYESDNCYYSREHQIYICQSCRDGYALYDCSKCLDSYVKFDVCEPRCLDCYGECSQIGSVIKCKSCIQGFAIETFCKDCIENYSKINGICVPNVVCNVSDMITPVHDIHSQETLVVFVSNINCSIINIQNLRITEHDLNPNGNTVASYRVSIIESDMSAEVYEGKIINGSIDLSAGNTSEHSFFGGIFASQTLDKLIVISHITVSLNVIIRGEKWCVSPLIADVSFENSRYNISNTEVSSTSFVLIGEGFIFGGLVGRYARKPYVDYSVNFANVTAEFSFNSSGETIYGSLAGLLCNATLNVSKCSVKDEVQLGGKANFSACVGEIGNDNVSTVSLLISSVVVNTKALLGTGFAGGLSSYIHKKAGAASSIRVLAEDLELFGTVGATSGERFAQLCAGMANAAVEVRNATIQLDASGFAASYTLFYGQSSSASVQGCTIEAEACVAGGTGTYSVDSVLTEVAGECVM